LLHCRTGGLIGNHGRWRRTTIRTAISAVAPVWSTVALVALRPPRLRIASQTQAPLRSVQHFAFVDPTFDSHDAVRRVSFGGTVFDIGAQGMQRELTLQVPLAARDLSAVQAAGHANLNSFATETQR
jgi:hypothetical protein